VYGIPVKQAGKWLQISFSYVTMIVKYTASFLQLCTVDDEWHIDLEEAMTWQ
jgi:hypothetical protein